MKVARLSVLRTGRLYPAREDPRYSFLLRGWVDLGAIVMPKGLRRWKTSNTRSRIEPANEKLYTCLIDWQKAFERVRWSKLMQFVRQTGIDWCERRLISKLYMDQSVKVDWTMRRQEAWRFEEELDKDVVATDCIQLIQILLLLLLLLLLFYWLLQPTCGF